MTRYYQRLAAQPDPTPKPIRVSQMATRHWSDMARPQGSEAGDFWDLVDRLDEARRHRLKAVSAIEKHLLARDEALAARAAGWEAEERQDQPTAAAQEAGSRGGKSTHNIGANNDERQDNHPAPRERKRPKRQDITRRTGRPRKGARPL